MLKIRRHKNITHTAVATVDEPETPNTKLQVAKFIAINAGVVAVVVGAKYAVAKMLNDNETDN